jgi:hypothetical protein
MKSFRSSAVPEGKNASTGAPILVRRQISMRIFQAFATVAVLELRTAPEFKSYGVNSPAHFQFRSVLTQHLKIN